MAENGEKEAPKNLDIPSITILDSEDEEEQTTEELFEGFIKAVAPFLQRKELLLLRVKFQALSPDFKCSSRFKDMLRRKANQVHKVDVYIHFNEVLNAVIRNAAVYGRKKSKKTEEKDSSDGNILSSSENETTQPQSRRENLAGNFENTEDSPMETSLNQSSESIDNDIQFVEVINTTTSTSGDFQNPKSSREKNIERERMKLKRKKLIAKLEAKLKYISDEIKKLSQAELSLEEMEFGDSSYIMESQLKKRFNTIWNKICKLKGRPTNTGRVVEGSVKCKISGFPAIDKAVGKFLKKRKGFPDIFDIRNIVIRVNKKHGLGLSQGVQNDIAADILTDIGNKLQKKRKKDFEYNFGCHLTDDCLPSLDPALNNSELRQKLEANKRVNQNALDSVFERYVHLGRVKGTKDNSSDSKPTTESDTESEEESPRRGKRKITKEREHSESDSEDESLKKKDKRTKISLDNREEIFSVDIDVTPAPTTNGTDMQTTSYESCTVETENVHSNFENSTVTTNGEQPLVNDEVPSTTIIDNEEKGVKPRTDNDKSIQKRKSGINPTKLLLKIQELKDNQLSKFTEKNSSAGPVLGSNEKVDFCRSKRKATSVRHIAQNQEYSHSSTSNGILGKETLQHNTAKEDDSTNGQEPEFSLKIPLMSTTKIIAFSPKKDMSGLQESLKNCPASTTAKSNSVLQNNILSDKEEHGFSDASECRGSSPKVKMSTRSTKFSPQSKPNLPKQIEAVIILSDDEED